MGRKLDLKGKRFGKLIAIKTAGQDMRRNFLWECVCDCGGKAFPAASDLSNGNVMSCGCLKPGRKRDPDRDSLLWRKCYYQSIIARCVKRGWTDYITIYQFKALAQKRCHYCGYKNSNTMVDVLDNNAKILYNGIDRVNNALGYSEDNVVACCKFCNIAKNNMTEARFKTWVRNIYKYYILGDKDGEYIYI